MYKNKLFHGFKPRQCLFFWLWEPWLLLVLFYFFSISGDRLSEFHLELRPFLFEMAASYNLLRAFLQKDVLQCLHQSMVGDAQQGPNFLICGNRGLILTFSEVCFVFLDISSSFCDWKLSWSYSFFRMFKSKKWGRVLPLRHRFPIKDSDKAVFLESIGTRLHCWAGRPALGRCRVKKY